MTRGWLARRLTERRLSAIVKIQRVFRKHRKRAMPRKKSHPPPPPARRDKSVNHPSSSCGIDGNVSTSVARNGKGTSVRVPPRVPLKPPKGMSANDEKLVATETEIPSIGRINGEPVTDKNASRYFATMSVQANDVNAQYKSNRNLTTPEANPSSISSVSAVICSALRSKKRLCLVGVLPGLQYAEVWNGVVTRRRIPKVI